MLCLSHLPGCQAASIQTARTTGANSKVPKNFSFVDTLPNRPCAVSASRKTVRRYTRRLAPATASIKTSLLLALTVVPSEVRKSNKTSKKIVKERVCNARPASKMLLPVFGSLEFDSEDPTMAAPAICMMVVKTSAVMKPHSITLDDNHQRCFSPIPIVAAHAMSPFIEKYIPAEMKTGATTMRKYCTTNQMTLYGSFREESVRNI